MRDGQRGLIVPYRFLEPYALIEDWPGDWERPVVARQKGDVVCAARVALALRGAAKQRGRSHPGLQ